MKFLINSIKVYRMQDDIVKSVFISTAAGLLFVTARVFFSREFTGLFLVWNLFLAYIPFMISSYIKKQSRRLSFKNLVLVMVWLLFFPNAPYIFTDFFHLYDSQNIPLWFDLILISLFAWNGLIIGFVSLKDLQHFISVRTSVKTGWIFAFSVIVLGSFGIYLGRYLRYNSWDVVTDPFYLSKDLIQIFINPLENKTAFGVTAVMSVFLSTTYYTFKMLMKSARVI